MPHLKKRRLIDATGAAVLLPSPRSRTIAGRPNATTFDDLGVDVFVMIYEFLGPIDIMRSRLCRKMSKAASTVAVPPTEFCVDSIGKFNAMRAMTRALPNLQQISLQYIFYYHDKGHRFVDGDDPDVRGNANDTSHDIAILLSFRKLRILDINHTSLNGRYPFLFNFPLLQSLTINNCDYLKLDLEMLEGLTMLKELTCSNIIFMRGNLNRLKVLKETLEKVTIRFCPNVEGNLMDLADFPSLVALDLYHTSISGDIRKIADTDYVKLKKITLPDSVYGCKEYEFHRVSDVSEVMHSIHRLRKRFLGFAEDWYWSLSEQSPDFYGCYPHPRAPDQPFFVTLVQAGSRWGWRWEDDSCEQTCEMNWLDPEPDRESSDYEEYIQKLQAIQEKIELFRGFHQPPTEEEYNRLCEEFILDT